MKVAQELSLPSHTWELYNNTLRAQVANDMRAPDGVWATLRHYGRAHIAGSQQYKELHHDARQAYKTLRNILAKERPSEIDVVANLCCLSDLCVEAEYNNKPNITIHHPSGRVEQIGPKEANARLIGYEAAILELYNLPPNLLRVLTENTINIYDYLHARNPEFTYQLLREIIKQYPDHPLSKNMTIPKKLSKKDPIEHQFVSKASTYYAQLKAHYVRLPPKANLKKYGREIELLLANTALRPKEPINFANPDGKTPHSREDTYAYLTAIDLLTKQAK